MVRVWIAPALTLVVWASCGRVAFDPTDGYDGSGGGDPCARPDVLLCDDFEAGSPASVWMPSISGGAVQGVVSTRAHGGTKSFQISVPATRAWGLLFFHLAPVSSGHVYVRSWMFVEDRAPVTGLRVFTAMDREAANGTEKISLDARSTDQLALYTFGQQYQISSMTLPRNAWHCFELDMTFGGSSDAVSVRVDGMEILASSGPIRVTFDRVDLGVGVDVDSEIVFCDDVLIATSTIGCT